MLSAINSNSNNFTKTSLLNKTIIDDKNNYENNSVTDSIGLDEPDTFFNMTTKNSNLSNKVNELEKKFELNDLKNFVRNKDLSLMDEIYLNINLGIGIVMVLIILWMTIEFCIRNYKRRKYDRIGLLNINSYYD